MERFSYEWVKFNRIIPEYENQFLNWVKILKPKDFRNKKILDAGCGTGRNSYWPLLYGAEEVVAFDHDRRIVEVAKKNLLRFKNVKVLYQSIYNIKYKNHFDIVFSIGVIHHLQYPRRAISNLIDSVKKNGIVLIWVYGRDGNRWIVGVINSLRYFTSKLPLKFVYFLSYFITMILWLHLKTFKQTHPYFKQISVFKFWHLRSIVFDQLIPQIANYWTNDEALNIFKDERLKDVKIYKVNNNSWTLIAKKKNSR